MAALFDRGFEDSVSQPRVPGAWKCYCVNFSLEVVNLFCWMQEGQVSVVFLSKIPPRARANCSWIASHRFFKSCGFFGWKRAELQPFSCCLPCNLCAFPNSHLHCQKWASSHLLPAGLLPTALLPFRQGKALPSLCPVPAGCSAWILSFAFILRTVPNQANTAVCVSPETSPSVWGLVGVVRERGVFSYSNFGLKYRLLMTFSPEC